MQFRGEAARKENQKSKEGKSGAAPAPILEKIKPFKTNVVNI